MKIITKKSVIFAALAVVLLATALVISCNAPLDGFSDKEEPSKPGTGKVRLTINNRNASRTIMPKSSELSGIKYLLVLKGPTTAQDFYKTVSDGTNVTVSGIPSNTYTSAQVIAYKHTIDLDNTSGSTYATYAIGDSGSPSTGIGGAGFTINGSPIPLGTFTTTLYSPGTNSVNGNFVYNITAPSRISTTATDNTFVITNRADNSSAGSGNIVFGTPQTAIPLQSGSYNVVYTIKDMTSPVKKIAYFYEILHVYQNLTSTFEFTISDDIFPGIPGTGSGTITINGIEGFPDLAFVATVGGSNASVTSNGSGWEVKIDTTATNAVITFTVNNPTSGVTFVGWKLLPNVSTDLSTGNGITVTGNALTIDATENTSPVFDISTDNYLGVEISIDGQSATLANNIIRVYFAP